MHIEKFHAGALGNMCAHYERKAEIERGYRRENIDPERMSQNYNLVPVRDCSQVDFIERRIGELDLKRKPRKDAVRMVDCVVTQPEVVPMERSREFFGSAYIALGSIFGFENVISAWVHMDETTPHMHFAWVPVTDDGRLSAKEVVGRNVLKSLHDRVNRAVSDSMGFDVEIIVPSEKTAQKAAKYVEMPELKAATAEVERAKAELAEIERQKELVRQETRELEVECEGIEREIGTLGERIRELVVAIREKIHAIGRKAAALVPAFQPSVDCRSVDFAPNVARNPQEDMENLRKGNVNRGGFSGQYHRRR